LRRIPVARGPEGRLQQQDVAEHGDRGKGGDERGHERFDEHGTLQNRRPNLSSGQSRIGFRHPDEF